MMMVGTKNHGLCVLSVAFVTGRSNHLFSVDAKYALYRLPIFVIAMPKPHYFIQTIKQSMSGVNT